MWWLSEGGGRGRLLFMEPPGLRPDGALTFLTTLDVCHFKNDICRLRRIIHTSAQCKLCNIGQVQHGSKPPKATSRPGVAVPWVTCQIPANRNAQTEKTHDCGDGVLLPWLKCRRLLTWPKKIVTAGIFIRLISSAIVWYHATSASICNESSRRAVTAGRVDVEPKLKITWSHWRSTFKFFSCNSFLARVVKAQLVYKTARVDLRNFWPCHDRDHQLTNCRRYGVEQVQGCLDNPIFFFHKKVRTALCLQPT